MIEVITVSVLKITSKNKFMTPLYFVNKSEIGVAFMFVFVFLMIAYIFK